jgi:hypothetical protein
MIHIEEDSSHTNVAFACRVEMMLIGATKVLQKGGKLNFNQSLWSIARGLKDWIIVEQVTNNTKGARVAS